MRGSAGRVWRGPLVFFVALVVVLAGTVVLLLRGHGDAGDAGDDGVFVVTPPSRAADVDAAGAGDALESLVRAVDRRDPSAAADLAAAEQGGEAAAQLRSLATNAAHLRVQHFSLRYVDETTGMDADGRWTADVATTWQFGGFDTRRASADVGVTFDQGDDGRVRIVGIGAATDRTPIWMAGPVSVRRSPTTLVLVSAESSPAATRATLDQVFAEAQRAVPTVRRVVAWSRPRLVVEVPDSLDGLDRALDATSGSNAGIAAVTTAVGDGAASRSPVHVLINPDVFEGLGRLGAQVVLSHESTHVATDAPSSENPSWLIEGFADYVALRDVDLSVGRIAGRAITEVKRHGVPRALPDFADFHSDDGLALEATYEEAWLACTVFAERYGQDALMRLYDAGDGGARIPTAVARISGESYATFVAAWRARLSEISSATTPTGPGGLAGR